MHSVKGKRMKKIRTITGDIIPEMVGVTSMHDHTLKDMRPLNVYFKARFGSIPASMYEFKLDNFSFLKSGMVLLSDEHSLTDDMEYMIGEFQAFARTGGRTIVDGSPLGMRGNLLDLQKVSNVTGVNVVCATGLFAKMQLPDEIRQTIDLGKDAIKALLYDEIENGIEGTNVKPGFLKCGLYDIPDEGKIAKSADANTVNSMAKDVRDVMYACAEVARETGMSVQIHTESTLTPDFIIKAVDELLADTKVCPDQIVILHTDQFFTRPDILHKYLNELDATMEFSTYLHEELLKRGVNISIDTWGSPICNNMHYYPNDFDRMKVLVSLLKKGYEDHIVLGHDVVGKLYGVQYGNYGYTRITTFVPQMLKQLGFKDSVAGKLLAENPARILAYEG